MKTYVLMVARVFPATHPRKGEPTNFAQRIETYTKIHTIRGNYDLWKKRIDHVNEGKAVLSLREWTGKPYASKQREIRQLIEAGIENVFVYPDAVLVSGNMVSVFNLAKRDGLNLEDFRAWFPKSLENGALIHFTDFRYGLD